MTEGFIGFGSTRLQRRGERGRVMHFFFSLIVISGPAVLSYRGKTI